MPCQSCGKTVNRFLVTCPYCGADPGGEREDHPISSTPATTTGLASHGRYRPLQSQALFVQLMFGLFILGSIVVIATAWPYRNALLDIAANRPIRMDDAILAEERYEAVSLLLAGANIVLAAGFAVWFWRAYSNLAALGRPRKRKAGWAIGSWFIPIANFFIPYGIGAEIWTQSRGEPGVGAADRETNMEPVISWWALFLIMGLVNQVAFFSSADATEDPGRMASLVGLDVLSSVVAIAAAVAAIRFVRLATERQEDLARQLSFL